MNKKPIFISFEGGEGAGKTTQINRLKNYLENEGYSVVSTREPGGTPESEKIRDLVIQSNDAKWSAKAECLLFFAARQMHVERLIKPALSERKIVICDRFTDSTIAYQSFGHNLPIEFVKNIKREVIGDFEPDITFIFDIAPEMGLARSLKHNASTDNIKEKNEDRYEKLELSFHKRLREGFLTIAKENPQRCFVIDASDTIDNITNKLISIMKEKLENA